MRPFQFQRAESVEAAIRAAGTAKADGQPTQANSQFIAGGTTILDLMKLDVMRPATLVDINALGGAAAPARGLGGIEVSEAGIRFGALVRMTEAAEHESVARDYPVIAESLKLAASQQIRNMATLAGNVLQRTRCSYFRDTSWSDCNKRNPGSGCAAMDGVNRKHAVLGVSDQCIATYPGDFAQALIALDARVRIAGPNGAREIAFSQLHRRPEGTPDVETQLRPGEIITSLDVPAGPWTRRSLYLKIRDRESYEFALTSAAVALHIDGVSSVMRASRSAA